MRELKGGHYHNIVEITENAGKFLLEEYVVRLFTMIVFGVLSTMWLVHKLSLKCAYKQVDEPSCSTPRKRSFNLPSIASIEELRTPAFEDLLRSFWDGRSAKQANGDAKHLAVAYEGAQSLKDSRLPLTAIN